MRGVLERAAEFFLAPPERPEKPAPLPPAVRAVVLGSPADTAPLAAALALSLRATDHAPVAVVASWGIGREMRPTAATRAAARLASRLTAHDLPATPRGRLAWLPLPPDPAAAATAIRRASALVEGPLVTALAGARPPELEALVAEHDLAVVAARPDTTLARAALARLTERGIPASACPPPRRGLPRALALAGLAGPRLSIPGGHAGPPPELTSPGGHAGPPPGLTSPGGHAGPPPGLTSPGGHAGPPPDLKAPDRHAGNS
jgi:hypothetical protein